MLQGIHVPLAENSPDVVEELAMLRSRLDALLAQSAQELQIMRSRCDHLRRTMDGIGVSNSHFRARAAACEKLSSLSARELEVLKAIAEGLSTKEVAHRLSITFKTAVSHRTRLMAKLDIHETAGLVRLAIAAGLVPLEA